MRIAALWEELGVFGRCTDQLVLLGERRRRCRRSETGERLREQLLGDDAHRLGGADVSGGRDRGGLLDDAGRIARHKPTMPHMLFWPRARVCRTAATQRVGLGADLLGPDAGSAGLARGIEDRSASGSCTSPFRWRADGAAAMPAGHVADLELALVDAYQTSLPMRAGRAAYQELSTCTVVSSRTVRMPSVK